MATSLGARWLAVGSLLMVVAACQGGDNGSALPAPSPSPSSTSTTSPSQSPTPTSSPSDVARKPGQLFYQRDDYVVRSASVPGGDEKQVVPLRQGNTLWLAAEGKSVYWIRSGHLSYLTLGTSTLDGDDAHRVARLGLGTHGLAVWDGYVYWANGRGYGRVKTDGSALDRQFMTLPPDHGGTAEGFAIADGNVYFSDCAGRRIGRVALTGGQASSVEWLVATGKFVCPTAVTVGGGHLYWWDHERGTVSQATTDGEDVNSHWLKIPRSFDPSANLAYFDRDVYLKYSATREGPTYIARVAEDGTQFTLRFRHTNFVSAFAVTAQ